MSFSDLSIHETSRFLSLEPQEKLCVKSYYDLISLTHDSQKLDLYNEAFQILKNVNHLQMVLLFLKLAKEENLIKIIDFPAPDTLYQFRTNLYEISFHIMLQLICKVADDSWLDFTSIEELIKNTNDRYFYRIESLNADPLFIFNKIKTIGIVHTFKRTLLGLIDSYRMLSKKNKPGPASYHLFSKLFTLMETFIGTNRIELGEFRFRRACFLEYIKNPTNWQAQCEAIKENLQLTMDYYPQDYYPHNCIKQLRIGQHFFDMALIKMIHSSEEIQNASVLLKRAHQLIENFYVKNQNEKTKIFLMNIKATLASTLIRLNKTKQASKYVEPLRSFIQQNESCANLTSLIKVVQFFDFSKSRINEPL